MTEEELNQFIDHCRKKLLSEMIAWIHGFIKDNEAIVVVRLAEGCNYDVIEDLEEFLINEIADKLSRRQTIEFYWQLMR